MSEYEINPFYKPKPYMTVRLNDRNPDMIEIRCPKKKFSILFDVQAGAELVTAINDLCREAGHAYIPNLGQHDGEGEQQ